MEIMKFDGCFFFLFLGGGMVQNQGVVSRRVCMGR